MDSISLNCEVRSAIIIVINNMIMCICIPVRSLPSLIDCSLSISCDFSFKRIAMVESFKVTSLLSSSILVNNHSI